MDNQEQYYNPSREELIRAARESCTKNLNSVNGNHRNYNSLKYKESINDNKKDGKSISSGIGIKYFAIRTIFAIAIFLTVFAIDKLGINLYTVNSDFISNCISTNQGIEEAQDYVVSVFENIVNSEKNTE